MPAASTAAWADSRSVTSSSSGVAVDLAGDLLGALGMSMSPTQTSAPSAASRAAIAAPMPLRAAGDQRLASLQPHRAASIDWRALDLGPANRSRSSAAPAPSAPAWRGAGRRPACRSCSARARPSAPRRRRRRSARRSPAPTSRASRTTRRPSAGEIVFLTVPFRAQSENLNNLARGAAAGPDPGRLHGPARRRGQRQGDPLARRLAGLGGPAGAGDGPRGRHRRLRPAHGRRPDPRRPRRRARRGRARLRRQEGRQGAGRAADRADPRPARGQRRRRSRWPASSSS